MAFFDKAYQVLLVLLLIVASGFALFINNKYVDMSVFMVAFAGVLYYKPNLGWVVKYTAIFSILMFVQGAWYGVFYFKTALYQVLLFSTAAMSVALLGINLLYIYNKILLVIAIIAIILFIPILVNPGFADVLISISPIHIVTSAKVYGFETVSHNILVMHFPPDFIFGLIRNSGPFWEPGAFGGYLIIAFVFNTLLYNTIYRKENLVYLAAILTTFSTTTYMAMLFFIAAYFFVQIRNPAVKWSSLVIFLIIAFIAFQKIDFLGAKIQKEFKETKFQALMKGGDTRMASAYLDLKEITENGVTLFFGRGSHPDTRVQGIDKEVIRTNGITDLLSRFGLPFFLFSIWGLYKSYLLITSAGNGKSQMAIIALITTLIVAFSEIYFAYLFFKVLILFYMSTIYFRRSRHTSTSSYSPLNSNLRKQKLTNLNLKINLN